jgi:hypothetical protein
MTTHKLNLDGAKPLPRTGHLRMGGSNPDGLEIGANSQFLTLGGQPWFPRMGEFHFSRYPRASWREELLKMKAGGITVCATYIFWNYHEETKGRFLWHDNRDLRAFVELCGQVGLWSYPRIGPWAHGEARSGGFPDWLLGECGSMLRCDDPLYLSYARKFYEEIAGQLKGLLWKDGGPVIGIQLENELLDNPQHIATLKSLALEAGLQVPLYTMTGWGPAQVPEDEVIPVFGGYPDAFWDRHHDSWSRPCRKHFFFSPIRDDNAIGADLRVSAWAPDLSYLERYPFGTCELGGGMPPSYHRRPLIDPRDIDSIAFCKLGSGANLLGYYMYHGSTHAQGELTSLQETQESGYPNDLAARSYDFQAPLGEFGQLRPHYHRLRRLHLFLQDFGAMLAPMPPVFPAVQPSGLDDTTTARWAVRSDGNSGFLFVNTYQRIESLSGQPHTRFEVELGDERFLLPLQPVDIPEGVQLLWPFNLDLGGIRLRSASANLLCRIQANRQPCFVFSAVDGIAPEFVFDAGEFNSAAGAEHQVERSAGLVRIHGLVPGPGCVLEVRGASGPAVSLMVLSDADSLKLYKLDLWEAEHLLLSPAALWTDQTLHLSSRQPGDLWFALFPQPRNTPALSGVPLKSGRLGVFTKYEAEVASRSIQAEARKVQAAQPAGPVTIGPAGVAQAPNDEAYRAAETWHVRIPPDGLDAVHELYLQVEYSGDTARAYLSEDGKQELVADDFWTGRVWETGLRRFFPRVMSAGLELRFLPLRQDAPVYIPPECLPHFQNGQALEVRAIRLVPEYEIILD